MSQSNRLLLIAMVLFSPHIVLAQSLEVFRDTLKGLVTAAAVSGHEQRLAASIADRLRRDGLSPKVDAMSNVVVTLGTGKPHRLLIANVDEPGYVVSGFTEEGYLRIHRIMAARPHPYFDQYFEGQKLWIHTATGQTISGVSAIPSTHLARGRNPAEHPFDLADAYVDVGARSEADIRRLGIRILDAISLEKTFSVLAQDRVSGPFLSDRAGATVLLSILGTTPASEITGTVTIAFTVQEHFNRKGIDRISAEFEADEVYLLEAQNYVPESSETISSLGSGVLVDAQGAPRVRRMLARFGGMIHEGNMTPLPAAPAWKPGTEVVRVGIPVMFYQSPVEVLDLKDLRSAVRFLRGLIQSGQS